MGDVNVIPVTRRRRRHAERRRLRRDAFARRRCRRGFGAGHLVIRPEFVRFLAQPAEADNASTGRLYNEYALGSRIQYQVRVGEQVFIVEKLRQQAFAGRLDDDGADRLGRRATPSW